MKKKMFLCFFYITLVLFIQLSTANLITINYQNGTGNKFIYLISEDYSHIEGTDLHSSISLEFIPNSSKSSSINIVLAILPFNQDNHLNSSDIELINVSFCNGEVRRPNYQVYLECRGDVEDLTNKMEIEDFPRWGVVRNYSVRGYYHYFSSKEFKNGERYSFSIEYRIKNFVIKSGDFYTLYDVDEMSPGSSKVIFLPEKASIKDIPERASPYITEDKRWMIAMPTNPPEWYFITYEITPWYKDFLGYIISFLIGGIILFIFSLLLDFRNSKKDEQRLEAVANKIVTKIRTTFYNQGEKLSQSQKKR